MTTLTQDPYWWQEAPREEATDIALPDKVDVAVVGAGYAGLSAALTLARAGRSVAVLDAGAPGSGASSRSGGMIGHGHRLSYSKLIAAHGAAKARAMIEAGMASLAFVKEMIVSEGIDARLQHVGRFRGAWTIADYDAMGREADLLSRDVGLPVELLPKSALHREIASDCYRGGLVFSSHGGVHPGLFQQGLLMVARNAGAVVVGYNPVLRIETGQRQHRVMTANGVLVAGDVVVATNGYCGPAVADLARRLVPFPSYLIATEEIGENRVRALIPNGRMIVETREKHLYYRPSPDGKRLILGGRAALHPIPLMEAGERLRRELLAIFPDLRDVAITHAWTGNVAMTRSDLPGIGQRGGLWYALGCNGSGVALMPWLGHRLAQKILGNPEGATAFDDIPFRALPFYDGRPWFLPLMTAWFRGRDWWRASRVG